MYWVRGEGRGGRRRGKEGEGRGGRKEGGGEERGRRREEGGRRRVCITRGSHAPQQHGVSVAVPLFSVW